MLEHLAAAQFAPVTPKLGRYFGASAGVLVVTIPERNVFKLQDGDVILVGRSQHPQQTRAVQDLALQVREFRQSGE